jgi:hypothetical protein
MQSGSMGKDTDKKKRKEEGKECERGWGRGDERIGVWVRLGLKLREGMRGLGFGLGWG